MLDIWKNVIKTKKKKQFSDSLDAWDSFLFPFQILLILVAAIIAKM